MPDRYGIFTEADRRHHHFAPALAAEIARLHTEFCPSLPVADYGCGPGFYTDFLRARGIEAWGVDGGVNEWRRPYIKDMNLCLPDEVILHGRWRMSVCLEVAEHIPQEFESVFLRNITRSAKVLALSWAVRDQVGIGHVNCRDNDEVVALMADRGFVYAENESVRVRETVREGRQCLWFANTFMLFLAKP